MGYHSATNDHSTFCAQVQRGSFHITCLLRHNCLSRCKIYPFHACFPPKTPGRTRCQWTRKFNTQPSCMTTDFKKHIVGEKEDGTTYTLSTPLRNQRTSNHPLPNHFLRNRTLQPTILPIPNSKKAILCFIASGHAVLNTPHRAVLQLPTHEIGIACCVEDTVVKGGEFVSVIVRTCWCVVPCIDGEFFCCPGFAAVGGGEGAGGAECAEGV